MNHRNEHVADYIIPATGAALPTETLYRIRHLMEADELPSVIVADDNRPVGVIRWSDSREARDIPDTCLARDIMLVDCPTLTVDSPASEAYASLDQADLDRLPVVNAGGELVGIVSRSTLLRTMNGANDISVSARRRVRRVFTVWPGMNVFSMDGLWLGLVERMFFDGGTVTGFMVAHGPLGRKHKHLHVNVVDHLQDETLLLSIDEDQFHSFPDMDA